MRELLKRERRFEDKHDKTERERRSRHDEHEKAWDRAQHAIVATFGRGRKGEGEGGTSSVRPLAAFEKRRGTCSQENVERHAIQNDVDSCGAGRAEFGMGRGRG